jgi:hypothetical protein
MRNAKLEMYLLPAGSLGFTDLLFLLLFDPDSEVGTAYFTPSTAYAEIWLDNLRLPFIIHANSLGWTERRTDAACLAPVSVKLDFKPFFFLGNRLFLFYRSSADLRFG